MRLLCTQKDSHVIVKLLSTIRHHYPLFYDVTVEIKMENTQFRECFFKLVALEGWSCKVCGKNFCRPPYSILRNHIKDVHLYLYQRVLKNFGAALQSFGTQ